MNFILWSVAIAVAYTVATQAWNAYQLSRFRRSGVYPQPGRATMADVEHLKKSGMPVWAIRCYREIHGCSLRQAKEAVANLPEKH